MSDLSNHLQKQLGKGMLAIRKQHSRDPFANWHRDLGHCFHFIFKEIVSCTQAIYEEQENEEALEILDALSKMFINTYAECVQNNLTGITRFNEIYGYIEEKGELASEVYNTMTNLLMQTLFSYLFTSTEMAIGVTKSLDQDNLEYVSVLNLLGSLDEETRKSATAQFVDNGIIPGKVDHSKLLRRLDPFIEVIKEDHARIKEEARQSKERAESKEALAAQASEEA